MVVKESVSVIRSVDRIVVVSEVSLVSVITDMTVSVACTIVSEASGTVSVVVVGVVDSCVIVVDPSDGTKVVEVTITVPPWMVVNVVAEYNVTMALGK